MSHEILTIEGKKYLRIGDKAIPIDSFDEHGKPVIKVAYSTETEHPGGRKDCTVHVPCFQIAGQTHKP